MKFLIIIENIKFLLIFVFAIIRPIRSEIFTSLIAIEQLVETEEILIRDFKEVLRFNEEKVNYLKGKLRELELKHKETVKDIPEYLSNPVNAFLLIKRLFIDWTVLEVDVEKNTDQDYFEKISSNWEELIYPTNEDLAGAAVGLLRLQDTYKLDASNLAKGIINGLQYNLNLSSDDCYELGRQSFEAGKFNHSFWWMNEALERFSDKNSNDLQLSKKRIWEYLAISKYELGDISSAIFFIKNIFNINPKDQTIFEDLDKFQKDLFDLRKNGYKNIISLVSAAIEETVQRLCRGEIKSNSYKSKTLKCRYFKEKNSFLTLAPFKMEQMHIDPFIAVFHDVLSDREIEFLKTRSRSQLKPAGVVGPNEASKFRTSQLIWFYDKDHKIIEDISRRVEDMTGLSMSTSEALQVVNYGIGGYYRHHNDFFRSKDPNLDLEDGDRTATVLFYMSDVGLGGGTAFPFLKLAVTPKKGSAVFWYNLHESGKPDFRTLHAACPVLVGTKWASNKWIRENGQIFRRLCGLKDDDSKSARLNIYI